MDRKVLEVSSLSLSLSLFLWLYLTIYLPTYLSLSICLFVYLSVYLQAWKRSYSARRPQFLNLTTSKMQQFSETSSIFELDNVKNEAILRDVLVFLKLTTSKTFKNEAILRDILQKWKVECRADGVVPMRFAIFPLHLSKLLRLPRKSEVVRSAAPVTQNHLSKPEDLMLQNATLSGNQRPDLLTALMNMSLALRLPRKIDLCRSSSNDPRLPSFLEMLQYPHALLTFDTVHNPLRLPRKTTSERPKVLRTPQFFALLTSKCASRHNGVHIFDISTSKSGPELVCFVHVYFEMCFAPQWRALFQHLNFRKCSEPVSFYTFDFEMCFAPQRRAILNLSFGQLALHPPL